MPEPHRRQHLAALKSRRRLEAVMKMLLTTAIVLFIVMLTLAPSSPSVPKPRGAEPSAQLGPADTYFVSQTMLGTPFQIDSGHLAEAKGATAAIRSYAQLMISSHITVNNALTAILKSKGPIPPPTLLKAAYSTILSTLKQESRQTFDADYVSGQVQYQKANAALYQYELANGADKDLKAFAQQTLPRIQDHLERALKLQGDDGNVR
jgi:putative membrane protein